MSGRDAARVIIDADLTLVRTENSRCVQVIKISTSSDEAILISSSGALPRTSWGMLRKFKSVATAIARESGQSVIFRHNGELLTEISCGNQASPAVSVRWWKVLKQILFGKR